MLYYALKTFSPFDETRSIMLGSASKRALFFHSTCVWRDFFYILQSVFLAFVNRLIYHVDHGTWQTAPNNKRELFAFSREI